ncbi:unnamed protein product [Blumeria hordei]|uniref:DDT domain-containing protein n=1 Tax=Blumeria hordei TaxID=2867405 RepID=A0A383V266_BLUHO|nr:unnamed protein product [Blumeria hordei]
MVLFKRKPVQYLSPPKVENDETEVWEIKQTGEIFIDYNSYLARMDFYKQRRFICQITGHSGLSYFEALKSELAGAQVVEEAFPEALKGPILRRVQLQTISRIDTLVDLIYEEFRADYYPGEAVTVHVMTGEKLTGIVRDKSSFGAKILPDGTKNPSFSRYFVSLDGRLDEEAVVDDTHISRDRKIFTKQVLRSFIRKTVIREAWNGAPWLVRNDVAKQYHIDVRVPPHLRYENKSTEKKSKSNNSKNSSGKSGTLDNNTENSGLTDPIIKLKPKAKCQKLNQQNGCLIPKSKNKTKTLVCRTSKESQQSLNSVRKISTSSSPPQESQNTEIAPTAAPRDLNISTSHPNLAPPVVKYPIEDLCLSPRLDRPTRPPLKFLTDDYSTSETSSKEKNKKILTESVGLLLETWVFLNIYCEILILDSFTFDDFLEAMKFSSLDKECQLLTEIHCAALKMLVASDIEGGDILVPLPGMGKDEGESADESISTSTNVESEPELKVRSTRRTYQKIDIPPEGKISHRAAEMQIGFNWIDRLRKRDFKYGGWQIVVIGLLYQLSKSPRHADVCETLLKQLAPLERDPTPETARRQYALLNVNHRVQVLEIICTFLANTKAARAYMEECSEQMTCFRKEKIQWQRDRKQYLEELRMLFDERKLLSPLDSSLSPSGINTISVIVESKENVGSIPDEIADTEDESKEVRSLRSGQDQIMQRKRNREAQREKKKKVELEAILSNNAKKSAKLAKDIQKKQELITKCENEIATLDNDLREADCPRVRILGKDRFYNRYYWFERNGMPYGGLPTSSTAHAKYANGRLWVQGPDEIEREGFIDLGPELQGNYKDKYGMTVPERKNLEEGPTSVYNAHQWGYYEDADSLNSLITWLDTRGINELKLHKELKLYHDQISYNMKRRSEYLQLDKSERSDTNRIMTRRMEHSSESSANRLSAWKNNIAYTEIGHLHSDEPRSRNLKKSAPNITTSSTNYSIKNEIKGKNKRNIVR